MSTGINKRQTGLENGMENGIENRIEKWNGKPNKKRKSCIEAIVM